MILCLIETYFEAHRSDSDSCSTPQALLKTNQNAMYMIKSRLCIQTPIVQLSPRSQSTCDYTLRLLKSALGLSSLISVSPFSFLFNICSNVPLLFSRFVGVPS
jgi:hypothetical protein